MRFCRPDCSYRAHRRRRGRDTRVCKPHTCRSRGAVCVAGCAPQRPGYAREASHPCGLLRVMRCGSACAAQWTAVLSPSRRGSPFRPFRMEASDAAGPPFRMPFRSLSDDRIRICSAPHGARALPTTVCVTFERKQKRRWCRKPKIEGSRGTGRCFRTLAQWCVVNENKKGSRGVYMTWRDVA